MKKLIALLAVALVALAFASCAPQQKEEKFSSELLTLDTPLMYETISSPLLIEGAAKGPMYFEAQFNVRLEDGNGDVLVQDYIMTTEDWMTEDFASFTKELVFATPETKEGTLIFRNDNPSGLPENEIEYKVPVFFE